MTLVSVNNDTFPLHNFSFDGRPESRKESKVHFAVKNSGTSMMMRTPDLRIGLCSLDKLLAADAKKLVLFCTTFVDNDFTIITDHRERANTVILHWTGSAFNANYGKIRKQKATIVGTSSLKIPFKKPQKQGII